MSAPEGKSAHRPRLQEAGLLIVILLLGTFLTFASDDITVRGETVNNFLRWDNLIPNVGTPMAVFAIMALGATMVVISGGIDISVGSIFGLSALGTAAVLQHIDYEASGWTVLPMAVLIPLAIGGLCGLINGLLIVSLRIHPFIVTLGTLSIFRGIGLISVESKSLPAPGETLPKIYTDVILWRVDYGKTFLQPMPMIIMVVCVIVIWLLLARTIWGRQIYAVGGNEEAARFSGIPVGRVLVRVYVLAGLLAGAAGMVSCGYNNSANTGTGQGYELSVIAAAVVGGASLRGGRGTALGAMLGATVIGMIENGIDVLREVSVFGLFSFKMSKEYEKIIIGLAIIVAVAADRLNDALRARRLARAALQKTEKDP